MRLNHCVRQTICVRHITMRATVHAHILPASVVASYRLPFVDMVHFSVDCGYQPFTLLAFHAPRPAPSLVFERAKARRRLLLLIAVSGIYVHLDEMQVVYQPVQHRPRCRWNCRTRRFRQRLPRVSVFLRCWFIHIFGIVVAALSGSRASAWYVSQPTFEGFDVVRSDFDSAFEFSDELVYRLSFRLEQVVFLAHRAAHFWTPPHFWISWSA